MNQYALYWKSMTGGSYHSAVSDLQGLNDV